MKMIRCTECKEYRYANSMFKLGLVWVCKECLLEERRAKGPR